MYSGDCAVKGRNSSSVAYQKSALAFAGSRHAIIYVVFIDDNLQTANIVQTLRRDDHSSRGVPPNVVLRCVGTRNLVNGEALAHRGRAVAPKTNRITES